MKIISGNIALHASGATVTPGQPNDLGVYPSGDKITYYTIDAVRESGQTKYRTRDMDLTSFSDVPYNGTSFWSHINGSTGGSISGASIAIGYRVRPTSGVTPFTAPNKLRISGTSISGSSGTAMVNYTPLIGPFMQLEIIALAYHATGDMSVDYNLIIQ